MPSPGLKQSQQKVFDQDLITVGSRQNGVGSLSIPTDLTTPTFRNQPNDFNSHSDIKRWSANSQSVKFQSISLDIMDNHRQPFFALHLTLT